MTEPHVATFAELGADTLYALLRLRSDVFIVEQACAYADIDGRDVESDTRHVWLTSDGTIVAYLRILAEDDGTARIGRVCVARDARRAGHAARLLAAALAVVGDRAAVLDAQTYATKVYEDAGFVRSGPEYVEDGIPHVPMRRGRPFT
jgi:ElaA protein